MKNAFSREGVAGSAMRVIAAGTVVGLGVSTVTAAASIAAPAWHATRIDPAVALRGE
jgi:ABC-type antimicrobial peptide transport system permease subunit